MNYRDMFGTLLVFMPVLMFLSYLAGTAHDHPKKIVNTDFLRLKKQVDNVCALHSFYVKKPSRIVSDDKCDYCKLEKRNKK